MLLKELFEGTERSEFAWNREMSDRKDSPTYALVANGKVVRTGLSAAAAQALQVRPDLVQKYGKLIIRKMA